MFFLLSLISMFLYCSIHKQCNYLKKNGWHRGDIFGGSEKPDSYLNAPEAKFTAQPQPKQATEALGAWGDWVQSAKNQPGYGMVPQDWSSIWNDAKQKINQYYWGSPTDPGIISKIKGSSASRGVSDSPALESQMSSLGASESQQLQNEAVQEAMNKVNFENQGLTNWLQNASSLSQVVTPGMFTTQQMNPAYNQWASQQNYTSPLDELGSMVGSGINLASKFMPTDWFTSAMQGLMKSPSSVTGDLSTDLSDLTSLAGDSSGLMSAFALL